MLDIGLFRIVLAVVIKTDISGFNKRKIIISHPINPRSKTSGVTSLVTWRQHQGSEFFASLTSRLGPSQLFLLLVMREQTGVVRILTFWITPKGREGKKFLPSNTLRDLSLQSGYTFELTGVVRRTPSAN